MPILTVRHTTRYRYRKPVRFGEHRFLFRPLASHDQHLLDAHLLITPEPVALRYVHDVFGNTVGLARFGEAADALTFQSDVRLDHNPAAPDLVQSEDWVGHGVESEDNVGFPFAYGAEDVPDLLRSIERHYPDPDRQVALWAQSFLADDRSQSVLDVLSAMTKAIPKEFSYVARLQVGVQAPLDTLRRRSGSCRDFAMLMMEAARALGLAAQFVSGYVYSPSDGSTPRRLGGGHTHAWLRVYLPSFGWTEFDPTNGIVGNHDLIRVAVARDPRQAIPLSGVWEGEPEDYLGMDVSVEVEVAGKSKPVRRVA
jgi:transglutaminase-like putative cysteine protease